MAKLPAPPPVEQLRARGRDLTRLPAGTVLWRIHHTVGPHVLPWNALRRFGPTSSRFDPHDPPPHLQTRGVIYLATDLATALAERFQDTRVVNRRRGAPHLTAFAAATDVDPLDLTGGWPLKVGASHTINTGRRDITRRWARTIVSAWPDTMGLLHTSALSGGRCVCLYDPGEAAIPARPDLSLPLDHPGLAPWLTAATAQIGYRLV